jgi:K+-transporting ATPase A subunit
MATRFGVREEEPLLQWERFPTHTFSFGILFSSCLITIVLLSYRRALALGPVLERLLFGR